MPGGVLCTMWSNILVDGNGWKLQQVGRESADVRNKYQMLDAAMISRMGPLSPAWKWEVVNYHLSQGLGTDKRHVQY